MLVFSLSPYLLRQFIFPTFEAGDYNKKKRGGDIWNQEGAKLSFFYFFLFVFFSLIFFQEVKRLDEIILKFHKFKYWKVQSSQRLFEQHWN